MSEKDSVHEGMKILFYPEQIRRQRVRQPKTRDKSNSKKIKYCITMEVDGVFPHDI